MNPTSLYYECVGLSAAEGFELACSFRAAVYFMPSLQPVILLAEDNENDISVLRRAFRQARLPALIHEVSDGDEAIEYLEGKGKYARRDEFPVPDLLLLDLKMPRRSGLEVISWVRRQPHLSALR